MKRLQVLGLGLMLLSVVGCGSDQSPSVPFNVNGGGSGGGPGGPGGHPLSGYWHHQFEGYSQSRQLASSLLKILPDGSVWLYDLEYGDFEGQNVGVLVPSPTNPSNFIVSELNGLYSRRGVFNEPMHCGNGHEFSGEMVIELVNQNEIHLIQRGHGRRHRQVPHQPYYRISESQASALIHQCSQNYREFTQHLICPQGRSWRLERIERVYPRGGVYVEWAYEIPVFGEFGFNVGFQPFEVRFDAGLNVEVNGGGRNRATRPWRYNTATSEIWMDLGTGANFGFGQRSYQGRPRYGRGPAQGRGHSHSQGYSQSSMTRGRYHAVSNNQMEIHFEMGGGVIAKYCYTR